VQWRSGANPGRLREGGGKFVILSRDKTCRNKTNSFEYSIIKIDGQKKIRDRFNEKNLQKDLENINSLSRRERKRVFHSDFCRINKDAELEHSLAVERLKSEGVVVCPHTSTPSHEPHTGHLPV
jgi:hypothetical protein